MPTAAGTIKAVVKKWKAYTSDEVKWSLYTQSCIVKICYYDWDRGNTNMTADFGLMPSSPSCYRVMIQLLTSWISTVDGLLHCVVDGGRVPPCGQKTFIHWTTNDPGGWVLFPGNVHTMSHGKLHKALMSFWHNMSLRIKYQVIIRTIINKWMVFSTYLSWHTCKSFGEVKFWGWKRSIRLQWLK